MNKIKVLIIDDSALTRAVLSKILQKDDDIEIIGTAVDPIVAQKKISMIKPDVITLDLDMPRMDGRELVTRIRGDDRAIYTYVIMLTGRSETNDLVAGMEAGADDFLAKSWEREELRVRLTAGERIIGLELRLAEQNRRLQHANERMREDLEAVRQGVEI